MSEFDVNLISAFAKCPAFYDKSNPNFKDRAFTENAWKEISMQLGFDEKVLRDRMFQLRNRYNLEKRKVEMQDGDPNAKSTWPLFDRMSFLEGHIRPRKSYKSIMNRSMEHGDQHGQFGNNAMFQFNHHRNNQQMRQYPQHHFSMQNAHNARLQQLANHIQLMASSNDDGSIDMNGDGSFPGLPNNLGLELSMLEGDDRTNPLQLFQQQQQQNQLLQRQQFLRAASGENNAEMKPEFYSESDEDEDGLRDTETETTNKSKEDGNSYGQRMNDASSSNQALSELLNNVGEEASSSGGRNDNHSRNGTVSEPGQSTTGNDVDEAFLNPMDILLTRQSTGSVQNSGGPANMRYGDPTKRKMDGTTPNQTQGNNMDMRSPQTFKRRRRNYQNMIPNGLLGGGQDNGLSGMNRPAMMLGGGAQNQMPLTALQGSNAMLANQAMLLAQLQNTLANQQTFLQQNSGITARHGPGQQSHNVLPDKFVSFGQFMASSLSELNDVTALELTAKFTVEVANALREQRRAAELKAAVTATSATTLPSGMASNSVHENHNNMNNLNATASNMQQQQNNIGDNNNYPTQQHFN